MSQENFEVIRRAITALNDRDIDRYLSCCTEDVQLQPAWAAVGGAYEGPDGIRRFFSDLSDIAPDFRIEIERLEPVQTTPGSRAPAPARGRASQRCHRQRARGRST